MIGLDDADIRALGERGYLVRDGFSGARAAAAARAAALAFAEAEGLWPAGLSRGAGYRRERERRGDEIAWLTPEQAPAGLTPLLERFEALRLGLNRTAYLGLARFDLQLARYPAGARYVRHLDAFPGGPNRRLTATYYLNAGWRPEDGGLLRLHLPEGPFDLEPVLDRLVVFLSDRVEHEVLPARTPRWAVTAWYYGREDLPP